MTIPNRPIGGFRTMRRQRLVDSVRSGSMTNQLSGTIRRLNDERHFGWIRDPETGIDYFFHATELIDVEFSQLRDGDTMKFTPVDHPKGPRASDVERTRIQPIR